VARVVGWVKATVLLALAYVASAAVIVLTRGLDEIAAAYLVLFAITIALNRVIAWRETQEWERALENEVFTRHTVIMQVLKHRKIAVMRRRRHKEGQAVLIETYGMVIRGRVVEVVQNTAENRARLYEISGFKDPEVWLEEMVKLYGHHPRYIVVIAIDSICISTHSLPEPDVLGCGS